MSLVRVCAVADVAAESAIGPASRVLTELSANADLVVLGTSDHHGMIASWLGSTPRWLAGEADTMPHDARWRSRSAYRSGGWSQS